MPQSPPPIPLWKRLKIVLVEWNDAAVETDTGNLDDVPNFGGIARTYEVGFLIEKTSQAIKLCTGIFPEDNTINTPITIPRKMVKKITVLGRAKDLIHYP